MTHVGSKESSPSEDVPGPEGARQVGPGVDGSEGGSDDAHDIQEARFVCVCVSMWLYDGR
jgi:hypothetical protein